MGLDAQGADYLREGEGASEGVAPQYEVGAAQQAVDCHQRARCCIAEDTFESQGALDYS
jgi:hypothetical protein